MSESTADVIARLQARYRPRAASPVTVRRRPSDVSTGRANGAQTSGYGRPNSLSSRRRGGKFPNTYRPGASDYAGMDAPTTRPAWGSVKPAGGRKIIDGNRALTGAASQDQYARDRERARYNLAVATGEMPGREV